MCKWIALRGNCHLGGMFPPMKLPLYSEESELPTNAYLGEIVMCQHKLYFFGNGWIELGPATFPKEMFFQCEVCGNYFEKNFENCPICKGEKHNGTDT